jgi:protein gp37
MDKSNIEWTDATWNIITGCTLVSAGCDNCYAAKMAATRLKNHPSRKGLTRRNASGVAKSTGEVRFNEKWLDQPLRWRKPRKIFVCAHGDLFHEDVPDGWIDQIFAVMALCPQHTFQVLTKRAGRMREYMNGAFDRIVIHMIRLVNEEGVPSVRKTCNALGIPWEKPKSADDWWPLANVWLGVSAEDQTRADERIPALLNTPAAIRFVSAGPLLGPMNLTRLQITKEHGFRAPVFVDCLNGKYPNSGMAYIGDWDITNPYPENASVISIDWVIVGGESGPNARPMHPQWARGLCDQCKAAGTAFFFKQWGEFASAKGQPGHLNIDHVFDDGYQMIRIGKKAAGRLLDGREWNGVPG